MIQTTDLTKRFDTITAVDHISAEIREDRGVFFVDGVRVLEVSGFKHGAASRGSVGLYVDIGTDGFFRNLTVTCED